MLKIMCDFCNYESDNDEGRRLYKLDLAYSIDDDGFDGMHVCDKCLATMHHGQLYKRYDQGGNQ